MTTSAAAPPGNIVLIGFMASGKTEVGRRLASLTGRRFVDTDVLVEAGGLSITDIFASEGEKGFRRREADAVAKASRSKGAVIATGGGAVLSGPNVKTLKKSGVLVYLKADADELSRRLEGSEGRPLLESPEGGRRAERNRIKQLLAERLPVYEQTADVVISVSGLDVDGVAREVLRRLDVAGKGPAKLKAVGVDVEPPYRVLVGRGLLRRAAALLPIPATAEKACIVSHPRVVRLWGDAIEKGLKGTRLDVTHVTFPEGEERKTIETAGRLYRRLAACGFHRSDVLVALGGGVVGDVTGFVASTYARGIPYVQAPTTLLAMVDAAIGGKTGFNLPEAKNLVGTFYHPLAVLADLDTVRTLPEREYGGGLAEVAKYAFIADPSLGETLAAQRDDVLARGDILEEIVLRSAAIKAEVVASDERESGRRAILNYGHTLGHALEAMAIAGRLPSLHHGEAISIGMVFAAWVSVVIGLAQKDLVEDHVGLLAAMGLPTMLAGRPPSWDDVRRYMQMDKKYARGLRLVLLSEAGAPMVQGDIPQAALQEAWRHVTES
jgi:3-dehydroquinate synthase